MVFDDAVRSRLQLAQEAREFAVSSLDLPDGRSLVYTSMRGETTDIYRYDLEAGTAVSIVSTPQSEYSHVEMKNPFSSKTVMLCSSST